MYRKKGRFEKHNTRGKTGYILASAAVCILAVLVVLRFAGKDAPDQKISESDASETRVPVSAVPEKTAQDHYAPVLDKYRRAITEGWSAEQCEIEGISPRVQAGADNSKVGYALLDLDHDGREELLVAEESVPHIDHIRDLYTTLEDGTPIQLWVDEFDGKQCYLYEDNILGMEYTTKVEAEYIFYTMESGQLVLQESLQYEDEDTVFHTDAEGNTRSVTPKEAMGISYSYNHMKLDLAWLADNSPNLQDTDSLERYLPVLEKYKTALLEKWDFEKCRENDICYMIAWLTETPEDLGAYYMCLDSDSTEELFIINVDDCTIYDMYTLKDGKPCKLISGGERNHYFLSTDNHIINRGSGSAFLSIFHDYVLYQGELVLVESVITDYQKDPENPWFRSPDGESLGQPLTEQEADSILNGYEIAHFAAIPILE